MQSKNKESTASVVFSLLSQLDDNDRLLSTLFASMEHEVDSGKHQHRIRNNPDIFAFFFFVGKKKKIK